MNLGEAHVYETREKMWDGVAVRPGFSLRKFVQIEAGFPVRELHSMAWKFVQIEASFPVRELRWMAWK